MVETTLGYNFQFPGNDKYQNTFHGLLTSFCRNQANGNKIFKNCEPRTYVFSVFVCGHTSFFDLGTMKWRFRCKKNQLILKNVMIKNK